MMLISNYNINVGLFLYIENIGKNIKIPYSKISNIKYKIIVNK